MRHNFLETITGAIVLLVAGAFFAFGYQYSSHKHVPMIHLKACFNRADGLTLGSDVRVSGVSVGSVTYIDIDKKNFKASLMLNVDETLKLPKDTSAEVVSESLMGGKYINLTPGGDTDILKNGDKITITQSSVSLEGLLSKYIFSQNSNSDKK